jgi:hypothetical protein
MQRVFENQIEKNKTILDRQDETAKTLLTVASKAELSKSIHESILVDANKKISIANSQMESNVTLLTAQYAKTASSLDSISSIVERLDKQFENSVIKNIQTYQEEVDNHITKILGDIWHNTSIIANHAGSLNQGAEKDKVKV